MKLVNIAALTSNKLLAVEQSANISGIDQVFVSLKDNRLAELYGVPKVGRKTYIGLQAGPLKSEPVDVRGYEKLLVTFHTPITFVRAN